MKDLIYTIRDFYTVNEQNCSFLGIKEQIENNGSFGLIVKDFKLNIYTSQLGFLLFSNTINAHNNSEKKNEVLEIKPYLNTFTEAYKEGQKFFEVNYSVTPSILYGSNEVYLNELHNNYLHNPPFENSAYNGWIFVKQFYPTMLSHNTIKTFGFYSGVVSRLEEIKIKHSLLFASIENCKVEQKPAFLDFIHKVKDKEAFVSDFKEVVQNLKPTPLMVAVDELKKEGIILIPYGAFSSFVKQLGILLSREFTQQGLDQADKNKGKFDIDVTRKVKALIIKHS